jgi:GT2 family glycosyltransferase
VEEKQKMRRFSISVVIPNYNGKILLEENLPYLIEALNKSGMDYEIIISDDASTDNSVSFIKKNYPFIYIITSQSNHGFSITINKGIMASTCDLVFALNSDVQVTQDYFLSQMKYFENKDTFGVMGRIIGLNNDSIQDGAKYPIKTLLSIKSTFNYILKKPSDEKKTPSLFLSGANALMDRKKVQELGGFDEIFSPFYGEDVDLSLRAWRLGWRCYYEHNAICRHPSSTTINAFHKKKKVKIISLRNKLVFHSIHLIGLRLHLYKVKIYSELIFRVITFQSYFLEAFKLYLKKSMEIRKSTAKLRSLMEKHPGSIQAHEVISLIRSEIEGLDIIKF